MGIDLIKYCELFYSSHFIPISIYKGKELIATFSSMDKRLDIFSAAATRCEVSQRNPDIFTLSEQGTYGVIHVKNKNYKLLIGPIFSSPITENTVLAIARHNFIDSKDIATLANFLTAIPSYSYNQFMNLIAFLHYSLNHQVFDVMAYFDAERNSIEQEIAKKHTTISYIAKEEKYTHGTYQFENILLSFVREGETEKLSQFLQKTLKTTELREGKLADTPLRQAKNLLIGLVTMVGKVGAIGGGMDVEETYRLIDLYIQECEKASSTEAVKLLQYNMLIDFTERVAQCKVPKNVSMEIFNCIQFIQNHTNQTIKIDDIVNYIGKSRSYITRKFREETGMTITDFIIKSKIKDAKRLLRYSHKSLSEISSYLCFSSQAYFQTVFKKETGMTPNEYRKKHSIIENYLKYDALNSKTY